MAVTFRPYNHAEDYQNISNFLITNHQSGNVDGNWLEPMWEYMHFHPLLDASSLGKFGVWEENGDITAICHYEWHLGDAFFQFHPAYRHLREELLDHAEKNLSGISSKDGRKYLFAYINDNDPDFRALVLSHGYSRYPDETRPMLRCTIPDPYPTIVLPEGYHLTSLAEECDWAKVHQVMWRGFDHGNDVPMNEEEFESRRKMFDTPKARRDLKIAVAAPNGEFAAFCGMFYESTDHFAYVEPVATDPRYRRLGLGKAAVQEGIRRCAALGATVVYVGNDLPIYRSVGFRNIYNCECWLKYLD